jgi:hypothetical protein
LQGVSNIGCLAAHPAKHPGLSGDNPNYLLILPNVLRGAKLPLVANHRFIEIFFT